MKTRPEILTWMTVIMMAIAFSMPLQIMILHGHAPMEIAQAFMKLTPLNLFVMASSLYCAYLAWHASPWLKIAVPATILLVFWNNVALEWSPLNEFPRGIALAALITFLGLQSAWFHPEVRRVVNTPKLRWWLTPRRKKMRFPVFVRTPQGELFKTHTFDLSSGGMFIPLGIQDLNGMSRSSPIGELDVGKRIDLNIVLNPLHTLSCEAEVARKCLTEKGQYPPGLGLRIIKYHGEAQTELERTIEKAAA